MSRVAYVRAWPRDPATGAPTQIGMAGGGSHVPYTMGYRAGIVREPRFAAALGFDEKGWTGAALPTVSEIEFAPSDPATVRAYADLYWKGAAIEVDAGDEYAGIGRILTGTIADAVVRDSKLLITVADFGVQLAKPAVQAWFAGTGGIEGDAVCEGRVKRRSYGYCANVEGRVLLAAYNIYEFGDPARGFQSFPVVRDMGREGPITVLGWQGGIQATLDALIAAAPPQGGAVVAPSIACVKWWTQPAGPLTADIQGENAGGYVETAAQIAARLLSAANGPAIVNLAAAVALRPAVAGLHIGDDSETTTAALDRLLLPVSLMWRFGTAGLIDIREWSWDGEAEVIRGRFLGRVKTLPPTKTRRLGYNKNHRQQSEGEIAADILAAGLTYADGTTLEQLKPAEGGANVTGNHTSAAFAGQGALATRNDVIFGSHVTSLPAAIDPANLIGGNYLSAGYGRYIDGTTIQALRPGEAGANITESRVASAIAGQGSFATLSSVGLGSPLLTGFGSLAGLGSLFFGSPYLLESSGGAQATLSAFKTALGIASGFSGQGAFATLSSLGFGSPLLTGFGSLAGTDRVRLGINGGMVNEANNAWLTDGSVITGLGTAAAIFGQGFGATAAQYLVDNRRVALGQNSAINSRFARGVYGWMSGTGTQNGQSFSMSSGVNLNATYSGKRDVFWACVNTGIGVPWNDTGNNYAEALITRSPWGGASAADMKLFALPVKAGDTIACAALVARHRCRSQVYALILDENGGLAEAPNWEGGREGGAGDGGNPDMFDRVGGCANINSPSARYAVFMVRMLPTGQDQPYVFVTEVMLGKVQPGQTELPAYNDGPADPVADQTGVNTASGIFGQGVLATMSSLGFGSPLLTGFGALAGTDRVRLGINGGMVNEANNAWLTDGSVITSLGTAGAIIGQSAWATFGTSTGVVSRLQSDGYMQASGVYLPNVNFLHNVFPGEYGANVTEGRTAAAFAGQGPWATYGKAISQIVAPRGNLFPYPRPTRDGRSPAQLGWGTFFSGNDPEGFSGVTAYDGNVQGGGIYVMSRNGNVGSKTALAYFDVEMRDAASWVASGRLAGVSLNGYASNGTFLPYAEWVNGAKDQSGGQVSLFYNPDTGRYEGVLGAPPSWAAYLRVLPRGLYNPFNGYQDLCWWGIKVEPEAVTPYQDVSEIRGLTVEWATGQMLNVLRPAEFGSNVTESRTAAAFAGQGAFATQSYLNLDNGSFFQQPSRFYASEHGAQYFAASAIAFSAASGGNTMQNLRPAEYGSNVTESRTSAAIAGQSSWATYTGLSTQTIEGRTQRLQSDGYVQANAIYYVSGGSFNGFVSDYRPQEAGANVTEGRTAAAFAGQGQLATRSSLGWTDPLFTGRPQYLTDVVDRPGYPGEKSLRSDYIIQQGSNVALVNRWPQEAGANVTEGRTAAAIAGQSSWATYTGLSTQTIEGRTQRLQTDGAMESTYIYKANVGGLSGWWPQEPNANVTEGRTAAAIAGQGAFATQSWINSGNVASFFSYSAFRLDYNITRFDGTTIVTESMVITSSGVAAGIIGQGAGATANNLAQLDPAAKSVLDGLAQSGPGSMTVGYGEVRSIAINAGAGRNIFGAVYVDGASGSQFGDIAASILWRVRGGNWGTLATGSASTVGPQEPGGADVTTTFTNNTGVNQVFEFMVTITRNGNAGGNVVSSRSYLSA